MSFLAAMGKGLERAAGAPRLLLLLWAVNALVALPLAAVMAISIHRSVGESLVHEKLVEGFDLPWFGEYQAAARGIERSLRPTVIGAAAFFDNLEAWWTGSFLGAFPELAAMGVLFALFWAFLLGGLIQWLARPPAFEGQLFTGAFFDHCGRFFFRFVRLAVISAVFYWLVYRLARWLFRALQAGSRDVLVERTVFLQVLAGAALVIFLLVLVRVVFDYAKVVTVVENRHGMLVAAWAGLRFVLRHPVKTLGLYGGVALLWGVVLALYALLAPGPGQSTWLVVILAFLVAQVVLMLKLGLRLALLGGEVALYRSSVGAATS